MSESLTILYADDDDDIRTIVQMSLSLDPDIDLHVGKDGAAALGLIGEGLRPHAILLDVMMPGMTGPEILAALRMIPDVAATPVIFMTARTRQADLASYLALGATGVILKPFDPMTLACEVRGLLRR